MTSRTEEPDLRRGWPGRSGIVTIGAWHPPPGLRACWSVMPSLSACGRCWARQRRVWARWLPSGDRPGSGRRRWWRPARPGGRSWRQGTAGAGARWRPTFGVMRQLMSRWIACRRGGTPSPAGRPTQSGWALGLPGGAAPDSELRRSMACTGAGEPSRAYAGPLTVDDGNGLTARRCHGWPPWAARC